MQALLNTLYCPNCGRANPYDNVICGRCRTRLDNPRKVEMHQSAYEFPHKQPKEINCPSPLCDAQVYYPSPLKEGTYHASNTPTGRENILNNSKQQGVFCWKCGQYVLKPSAQLNKDNLSFLLMGFLIGIILILFIVII